MSFPTLHPSLLADPTKSSQIKVHHSYRSRRSRAAVIVAVNAQMMVGLDPARVLLRQVDNGLTTILAMNFNGVLCNF